MALNAACVAVAAAVTIPSTVLSASPSCFISGKLTPTLRNINLRESAAPFSKSGILQSASNSSNEPDPAAGKCVGNLGLCSSHGRRGRGSAMMTLEMVRSNSYEEGCGVTAWSSKLHPSNGNGRNGGSSSSNLLAAATDTPPPAAAADPADDTRAANRTISMGPGRDRRAVSRAFNRALGTILSTGDMFGNMGSRSINDDNSLGKGFTFEVGVDEGGKISGEGIDSRAEEEDDDEQEGEEDDDDEDEDDEQGEDAKDGAYDASSAADALGLGAGSLFPGSKNAASWRRLGQKKRKPSATNRLLRAKTAASAAIVVDGPFSKLEEYMTLPVSEYSLLDSSMIQRISDTAFRFQIPLKHFFALDFTPTMEVEVELDAKAKAVVFRSTRSTLYGNVGKPGEEAYTNPWPAATANQTEYFRVGFDARLKWADGDASKEPRQRGRGAFTGSYSRRPRPPPTPLPVPSSHQDSTAAPGLAANEVTKPGETGAAAASSSLTEAAANRENGADLPLTEAVNPLSTVFCETAVKVQVLLPPPYNTMLPWRLVRALLGRILSTVVAFILPRFLERLVDDYYGWQSGTRQAAATASESARSLLGVKSPGVSSGKALTEEQRRQNMGFGKDMEAEAARQNGKKGSSSKGVTNSSVNPVVEGFQRRLRNVRGSDNGIVGKAAAESRSGRNGDTETSISDGQSPEGLEDWAADAAIVEKQVEGGNDDDEVDMGGKMDGYDSRQLRRWGRGWGGGSRRGDNSGGGDGPVSWWG